MGQNPLLLTAENELDDIPPRMQPKQLARTLSSAGGAPRTVSVGAQAAHGERIKLMVLLSGAVGFFAFAGLDYPDALLQAFLGEVSDEFGKQFSAEEVAAANRPHSLVDFYDFLNRTKVAYNDTAQQQSYAKIHSELGSVEHILTDNLENMILRGINLDRVEEKSQSLMTHSQSYLRSTKRLNLLRLWQKYLPLVVVAAVVFLFILLRFYWFY